MRHTVKLSWLVGLACICLLGCPSSEGTGGDAAKGDAAKGDAPVKEQKLVIYSARSKKLVDPVIKKFEAEHGVKVDVRYGEAVALVNKVRAEGDNTEADLFFAQDLGNLGVLRDAKRLVPLPEALTTKVKENFREPSNTWVPVSGRLRVLVYHPEKIKPEELPKTLKELADPKWKGKLGWAPQNGSFQVHVSGLRKVWGDEATEKWLADIKALEPGRYPKNSPQVNAVSNGEIEIGWVNHYYLHTLRKANPALKAANYSFSTDGDAGNLLMLSGVGILAGAKNASSAEKFIAFLLGEATQKHFAQETFEYPVIDGVETHKDVEALGPDKLLKVDPQSLTDLEPTRALLKKLELL